MPKKKSEAVNPHTEESPVESQQEKSLIKRVWDFFSPHRIITGSAVSNVAASALNTFQQNTLARLFKTLSGVGMNFFHFRNMWNKGDPFIEIHEKLQQDEFLLGNEKAEALKN